MLNVADAHLNYLAILVVAIIFMVLGFIWYHPKVFGKTWMEASGYRTDEMPEGMALAYGLGFISALVTAFVLALLIYSLNIHDAWNGACVGIWAWLGFVVTGLLGAVAWDKKPWKVAFIHAGYKLVAFIIGGALLGAWQ